METPYVGTKFRVTGTFEVVATSVVTDTTPVDMTVRNPAGTRTTYQYPASTAIVKDTTGTYHVDVLPDDDGDWIIGVGSTGGVCAYNEVTVRVLPRRV